MMISKDKKLFSIGYAGYALDDFLEVLKTNQIDAVVDVRARPQISHFACYRQQNIKPTLLANGIIYKYFGNALGARPQDPALYTDGKADFAKIRSSDSFVATCRNLAVGLDKGLNICLMCAQIDPLNCHRAVLITDFFRQLYPDIPVMHLQPSGDESQAQLDMRLLRLYRKKFAQSFLLPVAGQEGLGEMQKAYAWQAEKIAYCPEQHPGR